MSATTEEAPQAAIARDEGPQDEQKPLTEAEQALVRGDATPDDDLAQVARETKGALGIPARRQWDSGQTAIMRATVFRGLSPEELGLTLEIAHRYVLDPMIGELFAAKFDGADGKITVWAGRDGLLKAARNTGRLRHVESHVVRENDTFMVTLDSKRTKTDEDGSIITGASEVVFEQLGMGTEMRGKIVGAFALVWVEGEDQPWFAQAAWEDYGAPRQTDDEGEPTIWTIDHGFTEAMMIKVPQSIALRMALGLTGLYSEEEVWKLVQSQQRDAAGTAATGTAVAGPTVEWPQSELGLTLQAYVERANELRPGSWRPAKVAMRVNGRDVGELEVLADELRDFIAAQEPTSDLLGRAAENVRVTVQPDDSAPSGSAAARAEEAAAQQQPEDLDALLKGAFPDALLRTLTVRKSEPIRASVQERAAALRDGMQQDPDSVAERFGFGAMEDVAAEIERLEVALRAATNGGPTVTEAAVTDEAAPDRDVAAELKAAAIEKAAAVADDELPEFDPQEMGELLAVIDDLKDSLVNAPSEEVASMLASNLEDALDRAALLVRAAPDGVLGEGSF